MSESVSWEGRASTKPIQRGRDRYVNSGNSDSIADISEYPVNIGLHPCDASHLIWPDQREVPARTINQSYANVLLRPSQAPHDDISVIIQSTRGEKKFPFPKTAKV